MVNSRNKGSAYERDVKNRLIDSLGLEFSRVFSQWAEAGLPDLVCEDDAFPFVIECKRYKAGSAFASPAHWDQICRAATKAGKLPALVYKFDRLPERWRVPINALAMLSACKKAEACKMTFAYKVATDTAEEYDWRFACEMTFDNFCMVARELMCDAVSE